MHRFRGASAIPAGENSPTSRDGGGDHLAGMLNAGTTCLHLIKRVSRRRKPVFKRFYHNNFLLAQSDFEFHASQG
jgi:hypothetical protein